jgi:hypothetical protein
MVPLAPSIMFAPSSNIIMDSIINAIAYNSHLNIVLKTHPFAPNKANIHTCNSNALCCHIPKELMPINFPLSSIKHLLC